MPLLKGFIVSDADILNMEANLKSPKVCEGCGDALGLVKDIREKYYCSDCIPKVTRLNRYVAGMYSPTEEERRGLLKAFTRGGHE